MYFKTGTKENFGVSTVAGGNVPAVQAGADKHMNVWWYVAAAVVGIVVIGGLAYSLKKKD